jgi:hypothetical protein
MTELQMSATGGSGTTVRHNTQKYTSYKMHITLK